MLKHFIHTKYIIWLLVIPFILTISCENESRTSDGSVIISVEEADTLEELEKSNFVPPPLNKTRIEIEEAKKHRELTAAEYRLLGIYYKLSANNREKVIENYEKALELDPQHLETYNELGLNYWERNLNGDKSKSIDYFNKGVDLCRENPNKYNCAGILQNLATKYFIYDKGSKESNMQTVINLCKEGLTYPDEKEFDLHNRFQLLLGNAYRALGGEENYQKSRDAYNEVLKHEDSPWIYDAKDGLNSITWDSIKDRSGNNTR